MCHAGEQVNWEAADMHANKEEQDATRDGHIAVWKSREFEVKAGL